MRQRGYFKLILDFYIEYVLHIVNIVNMEHLSIYYAKLIQCWP